MRPDSYTAHSYLLIDKAVQAVESRLAVTIKPGCGYEKSAVSRRIAQAVAMRLVDPFLRKSIERHSSGEMYFIKGLPQKLFCGEMRINTETGVVAPSMRLLFSCVAKFVALWLFVLGSFIRSLLNKNNDSGAATLIFGVPDANLRVEGSAQRFEEFCQDGPLDVLSKANKCIVQVVRPVKVGNPQKFVYARFPLLALFSVNRLGVIEGLGFIKQHISVYFGFLFLILRNPVACLLWRDFAEHAVATAMNNKKLIEANIITNTNWLQQFLWMSDLSNRHFETYMALYSLNSSTLKFKDDPVAAAHPGIRHLRADLIWIWDAFYEKVLRHEGVFCRIQVVGPILWYLPKNILARRNSQVCRLCVFDVSPMTKEALLSRGMLGSYYSAQTMKSYLDDILVAADELQKQLGCEVEIVLKHKRTRTPAHDDSYFSYVNELCESNDHLRLVGEDLNLFSLITESDLVVVIPYSSPGYVANYLGVPALFYDPTNEILTTNEIASPIRFSAGLENLTKEMTKIMGRSGSVDKAATYHVNSQSHSLFPCAKH
jgi:hypothetical protein